MIVAPRRQQRSRAHNDAGRSGEYSSPACYLHEFETPATTAPGIEIKRIYAPAEPSDGYRVLIDRLWPRGISRGRAALDAWLGELAPSASLRQWFHRDASRWSEFRRRYRAELQHNPEAWNPLLHAARHGTITLIFSSHDLEHNNAVVLQEFLESRMSGARKAA